MLREQTYTMRLLPMDYLDEDVSYFLPNQTWVTSFCYNSVELKYRAGVYECLSYAHGCSGKESAYQCGRQTQFQSLGWEDFLEKEMATYPSLLAWEIPWIEEPGGLQSLEQQTVEHDLAIEHIFIYASSFCPSLHIYKVFCSLAMYIPCNF